MNRSTPGLPVHHQLPEFTQIHVHRVSDAIQPSHPLSSPSPPAPNPFQHQYFPVSQLFTWGGQSTGVSALASFLPKKSQGYLLQNGLVGSPCSPRDSLRLLIFLPAILIPAVLLPVQRFSWCTPHRSLRSRMTIYSLDVLLLFLFGTSLLFHV